MSQKIQFFLVICIAIASAVLLYNMQATREPILQDITITQPEERSITVMGTAEMQVKPDTAKFVIVIGSREEELADAKLQNEKTYLEVMGILDSHAIAKQDINSDYLRIQTEGTNARIYRYVVNRSVKVTLHNLTTIEPLFTDLQEAGVSRIDDIEFSSSQIDSQLLHTLELAIQAAQEKAKAIALGMGREIGNPISIQESPIEDQSTSIHFQNVAYYSPDLQYMYDIQFASFTEIPLKAVVTVTYELK